MSIYASIVIGSGVMTLIMALTWEWVRRTKNGGLTDVTWSYGLGAIAIFFCLAGPSDRSYQPRQIIAAVVIGLWALRLGTGLLRRNWGSPEDARYKEFRSAWGKKFLPRLFGLMIIQAFVAVLLASCAMLAAHNPTPLTIIDPIAVLWMLIALTGSLVSDSQLARFKRNPANKGKICDKGLWARSRHPNYVFEVMFWTGWPIMALSGGWFYGALGFIGTGVIYWLLRYVSGEPMMEKLMAQHYGADFTAYCRRVPPFLPRLTK